ncbi:hypothetical protein WJX81_003561 [Elliptochloris bilobata]|uniref:Arginyl-tRNA--protein transferase n=1 Tax=Elliptochloris bilobata TaxID=381761 RepID=A0AAW1QDL0_9CHLO
MERINVISGQLLDLGWRRSGHLLYRPILERSCCPPHTIRLAVEKFQPSKSQEKAAIGDLVAAGQLPPAPYPPPRLARPTEKLRARVKALAPDVAFTSPAALPIAAAARNAVPGAPALAAEEVAARLSAAPCECANGDARPAVPLGEARAAGKPAGGRGAPGDCAGPHRFEVVTLPSSHKVVAVEYPLYRKYQMLHHHQPAEEVSKRGFRRFLVDTPLASVRQEDCASGECPPCGFGTFHQQYWLDGMLVAVAVLDVLPRCLSSKYVFWDPDLAHLSLGKLTALREIAWVQAASCACPRLRYYYQGYYIESCMRMRYKAEYAPSDLLCSRAGVWVPFERVAAALRADPGCVLSQVPHALDGLGEEYLVPRRGDPHADDPDAGLRKLQLFVGSSRGGQADAGKQVASGYLQMDQLAALDAEAAAALLEALRPWQRLVGDLPERCMLFLPATLKM